MFSILDMFSIGVGPSSSHTVGPMRAAHAFVASLAECGLLDGVHRVRVTLYGSLSLTGLGHGTDRAAVAGLEGHLPETVDTDFDYGRDVVFDQWRRLAAHPNGMRFEAFDADGGTVDEQVWYSIGGGFIQRGNADDRLVGNHERVTAPSDAGSDDEAAGSDTGESPADTGVPYPFTTCDELIAICRRQGMSIADVVWANETAVRPADEVRERLLTVWRVMRECVANGCSSTEPVLPGGLDVPRRAPGMYARLATNGDILKRDAGRIDIVLESSDAASSPPCCCITGISWTWPTRRA